MEEAPVFRDDGAMRLLFGLTTMDLVVMGTIFVVCLKGLPLNGVPAIGVSIVVAWFLGLAVAKARAHLPIIAIKQYLAWLGQPDLYVPGRDEDARPLVYSLGDTRA